MQHSYQEITALLSRDYKEVATLLSRDYSTLIKRLQHSYQEITALLSRDYKTPVKRSQQNITKMLEYLSFCLLYALLALIFYLYFQTKRYLTLLKMAEEIFSGYETPQTYSKRQKLLECVLTGNSKLYLGKVYTKDQLKKLNDEEVEKLFNNYEAKLSGQMVKLLGCSIINMYSMGTCALLGISNQDVLSEDLENDPFLNSALQRFTCELYYRFGSFLAPLSVGIITSRLIYLSAIKMEEQVEQVEWKMNKNLSTSSKSAGFAPLHSWQLWGPRGLQRPWSCCGC